MTDLTTRLGDLIRKIKNDPDITPALAKKIQKFSDDELIQKSFRVLKDDYGERAILKSFGLTLFRAFYEHWEVEVKKPLSVKRHLMLARGCQLPYYIDEKKIVVFDTHIGVLLTLASGSVEQAIDGMFTFVREP